MTVISRKVVLLFTLHRRYHEFRENLERALERAEAELGYQPDVVLVWSSPEIARLWLVQELLAKGWLTHVLKRQPMSGEGLGAATTLFESANLRMGLSFIRERYPEDSFYAVALAADVHLQQDTLSFIDQRINGRVPEGPHNAVLFHWANGCTHEGVWHTNCFGVRLLERYWPPVAREGDPDVLERQWGRSLEGAPGLFRWHNSGEKRFQHRHLSEGLPEFPRKPQKSMSSLTMACTGWLPWYGRAWLWLKQTWLAVERWLAKPVWPTKCSDPSD